jgi:UDP-N-acetyl-D-glucosamine/UDP-N-acetyl-D-galactosamine dehydrogenase
VGGVVNFESANTSLPKTAILQLPGLNEVRVAVVGLGYVGLPVAAFVGLHFPVVGFDIDRKRVAELVRFLDRAGQISETELRTANAEFSHDITAIADCNFYIIAVPTPIDQAKRPDMAALRSASAVVGSVLKPGNVVVYESTVYPGATEEVCVPILESKSGLKLNVDFSVGYSPERINPADLQHRLPDIVKITSGSNPVAAELIDKVYARVVTAGTFKASSIRVAEAAKVIENVQRDVNIALVNELAMLFKALGLDTREVLEAAGTKWNFHPYTPGLVGGHCIGVDPYYLTHKAQSVGFHPDMILAGRRTNDNMPVFVAQDILKGMLQRRMKVDGAKLLVLGFTFKDNCPDIRNTKVAELIKRLQEFSIDVIIYDPLVEQEEAKQEYGLDVLTQLPQGLFDVIVYAVNHDQIKSQAPEVFSTRLKPQGFIFDIKSVLPSNISHARL